MQHLNMLATSEGRWVLPGTPEFFAALGDSDPDYDSVSFAVKNLGFVKLEVREQSKPGLSAPSGPPAAPIQVQKL